MKWFLAVGGILALCVCSACTTRGAYEGVRQGQRNHCNELPETQRQQCLAKVQDDYDTYSRDREAVSRNP